jgi:hypothetical protein
VGEYAGARPQGDASGALPVGEYAGARPHGDASGALLVGQLVTAQPQGLLVGAQGVAPDAQSQADVARGWPHVQVARARREGDVTAKPVGPGAGVH